MAKTYVTRHLHISAGRRLVNQHEIGLDMCVNGDMYVYGAEGAVAAGAASVTFKEPVRTAYFYATTPTWVAKSAAELDIPADGQSATGRLFIPANTRIELPWYYDEVHFKAVTGTGAIYVEGRL
jgi:hypothetical protein